MPSSLRELIDLPILVRNIKFITEVLCRYAYGHLDESNFEVLTGQYSVNEEFVKHWINYFGTTPRMAPYLGDSGLLDMLNKVNAFLVKKLQFSLFEVLTQYTQDVMKHNFK